MSPSLMWVLMCWRSRQGFRKLRGQMLQACGLSAMWVFLCTRRVAALLRIFAHTGQRCGFSESWTLACSKRADIPGKLLPQLRQLWEELPFGVSVLPSEDEQEEGVKDVRNSAVHVTWCRIVKARFSVNLSSTVPSACSHPHRFTHCHSPPE